MKAILVLAALAAMLAAPAAGHAAVEYFVSPQGDDGHPGSMDKPFKTIGKAATLAAPGDVIRVLPGTYAERVAPANSGTAEAPITIRNGGNAQVIWTAPDAPPAKGMGAALNLDGRSYWTVEDITFKDCTCWITMGEAHHVTIKDCVFDGSKIYNSMWINNGSYISILNCHFKRARPYVTNAQGVSTNVTAADFIEFFRNSHHNLVEGCRFGEIGHVAVSFSAFREGFQPHHNIVRGCVFTDPMWKCLGTHAAEYTLVEGCTMTGKAAVFFQFESPKAIVRRNVFVGYRSSLPDSNDPYRGVFRVASTKDGNATCDWRGNRIYHNLFYDNDRTITSYAARFAIEDNEFKNNIFYNNRMTLWLCQPTADTTRFVNNVLFGTKAGERFLGYETKQYTLAEAAEKMPAAYRGNLEADPRFVDAAKRDFQLAAGSPCVDAGANLTTTAEGGSGKVIPVEDPLYFCDGWGLIDGDQIVVGDSKPVKVLKVDYEKKTLEVDRDLTWKKGDGVNQPFAGKAPDIGPFERGTE